MAERIAPSEARKMDWHDPTKKRNYPWDTWQDGSIWVIYEDDDFDCPVASMQSMLHQRATAIERKVRTKRVTSDAGIRGIRFQFLPESKSKSKAKSKTKAKANGSAQGTSVPTAALAV